MSAKSEGHTSGDATIDLNDTGSDTTLHHARVTVSHTCARLGSLKVSTTRTQEGITAEVTHEVRSLPAGVTRVTLRGHSGSNCGDIPPSEAVAQLSLLHYHGTVLPGTRSLDCRRAGRGGRCSGHSLRPAPQCHGYDTWLSSARGPTPGIRG